MSEDTQPVEPQTPKTGDRELVRMKRALKAQQEEKTQLAEEFQAFKNQIETDKLSATERERKELNEAKAALLEASARAEKVAAENARLKQVNTLVSKHKLADEEYADIVLNKYAVAGDGEDFDAFVTALAAEAKYKVFFAQPAAPEPPRAPAMPGSGNTRDSAPTVSAMDKIKADAQELFPTDAARRNGFIEQMKQIKGIA